MFVSMFSRAAFLLLAAGLMIAPAQAQQPTPGALAAAREYLEVKGAKSMFEPVVLGIVEQSKAVYLQTNPGLAKDLDEVAAQLRAEYAPRTTEQLNQMAQLYAQRFTEQELKQAVAFYKTPLGQKMLTEEPKVIDASFQGMREWANKIEDEVRARMRVEMKKRGHDL